jgi:hypothetical protein
MIGMMLRNGEECYASEWNGALLIDQTNARRAQGADMGIIPTYGYGCLLLVVLTTLSLPPTAHDHTCNVSLSAKRKQGIRLSLWTARLNPTKHLGRGSGRRGLIQQDI